MGLTPFETVSDYPSMLNKIALYTFGSLLLAVVLLRLQIQPLDALLAPFSFALPIAGLSLPFGTVVPAFGIALLSRIFKLHDRLSDLFGIRRRFDVIAILFPLCAASGGLTDAGRVRQLKAKREPLMYATFYKYASSSPGKAVIETHYITLALDQWSWYWILLEACTIATLAAAVLFWAGRYLAAASVLAAVLLAIWLLQVIRGHCEEYALQQVEQILSEPARKREVREQFSAL